MKRNDDDEEEDDDKEDDDEDVKKVETSRENEKGIPKQSQKKQMKANWWMIVWESMSKDVGHLKNRRRQTY